MNFIPASVQSPASLESDAVTGLPAQIWRRRRVFAAVFAAVLLPALAAIAFLSPVYYAAGTVIIGNREPSSGPAAAAWLEKLGDPADLESQLQIVQSHRMLRLALARPGAADAVIEECRHKSGLARLLGRGEDCSKLTPNSQELLDHAETHYSVRAVGRSRIISIGYQSPLPDVAFALANALLITYLEDQRAENAHAREVTAAWLLQEAAKAGANIAAPDAAQSRQKFYQDLYEKAADLEAERRAFPGGARLVSLAELPKLPYFPKRTPLLAAALTLAAMLATLAALRRDVTGATVRRTQELEAMTGVPAVGILSRSAPPASRLFRLPFVASARAFAHKIAAWLCAAGPASAQSSEEEARTLYTRLVLIGAGKTLRSILIASATEGEGKTATALALAKTAADNGRKVLLIDCNMRRPALTSQFGVSAAPGLAGILRGEIEPAAAAVPAAFPGSSFIPAGSVRGDPTLLLIGGHLPKLMSWAEQYDLVILDGPAAASGPDAGILAQHAGGVLWCVAWGRALKFAVKTALDGLAKRRIHPLGFAITEACPEEMRFYERPRLFGPFCEAPR